MLHVTRSVYRTGASSSANVTASTATDSGISSRGSSLLASFNASSTAVWPSSSETRRGGAFGALGSPYW